MSYVKTSIYQMVCDRLDEEAVSSDTEDTKVVNWFNRNYDHMRRVLIATGKWNFAKRRQALAADATTPDFQWQYSYTLPGGTLAFYPLTVDGTKNGYRVPFHHEGGKILTDQEAPLNFRFIVDVDESEFHPLFAEYLICDMALKIAHWMTGKTSFIDPLERQLRKARRDALLFNAINDDAADPVPEEIIAVRTLY